MNIEKENGQFKNVIYSISMTYIFDFKIMHVENIASLIFIQQLQLYQDLKKNFI
jgi:hypothetical protein